MQTIKEVKNLLRDQLVNLWDGTWVREENHQELRFGMGHWHSLSYQKRLNGHKVFIGCAGEVDDFTTFIDIYAKSGLSRVAFLESPDDMRMIDAIVSRQGRERLEQEFIDAASRFVAG